MVVVLKHDVVFYDIDEVQVHIKKGTKLYVDMQEHIAFHDNRHFSIEPEEFTAIQ